MFTQNQRLFEQAVEQHMADQMRQAEIRRLVRGARPQRLESVSRAARWLLCGLGYQLVALGARLEACALPQCPLACADANGAC
jgi:hypothetical protein